MLAAAASTPAPVPEPAPAPVPAIAGEIAGTFAAAPVAAPVAEVAAPVVEVGRLRTPTPLLALTLALKKEDKTLACEIVKRVERRSVSFRSGVLGLCGRCIFVCFSLGFSLGFGFWVELGLS